MIMAQRTPVPSPLDKQASGRFACTNARGNVSTQSPPHFLTPPNRKLVRLIGEVALISCISILAKIGSPRTIEHDLAEVQMVGALSSTMVGPFWVDKHAALASGDGK